MHQQNKTDWKESFEKLCEHEYDGCYAHGEGQYCCLDIEHDRHKAIKDFIRTLLAEQREEICEKLKKELDNNTDDDIYLEGRNTGIDDALQIIKSKM